MKNYRNVFVKILLICCMWSAILDKGIAQQKDSVDLFSLDLEDLMNIQITTSSKKAESFYESASTMIVITDQMIADHGYHDLEEILHDLPGFDFNRAFGVEYSTIFMRGYRSSNTDRFILMYDGVIQNHIWKQNNIITHQLPISQIKQIEILYGPASALYGTNAFSGIINVITKDKNDGKDLNITLTSGSYGRKNFELNTKKMLSNDIGYNITFKYFDAADLHPWSYMNLDYDKNFCQSYKDFKKFKGKPMAMIDGTLQEIKIDDPFSYRDYGLHSNIFLGKELKLTMLYWMKKELQGFTYSPYKRRGNTAQWDECHYALRLSHNKVINEKIDVQSEVGYRQFNILDSKDLSTKCYSALDTVSSSGKYNTLSIVNNDPTTFLMKYTDTIQGLGTVYYYSLMAYELWAEEQLNYNVNSYLQFILGGRLTHINTQEDYNSGKTRTTMIYAPRHNKSKYGGYSQIVIKPIKELNIVIGGRSESSRDEYGNGYDVIVPRSSIVVKASDNLVFRLQYSEAFQEADDWHLFSTVPGDRNVPSPNLKPEKLKSFEFGATSNIAKKLWINGSLYYTIINDYIVEEKDLDQSGNILSTYHYINKSGDEVNIYGYEFCYNAPLFNGLSLSGNFSGAYNYKTDVKYDENYKVVLDDAGNPVKEHNVLIGDIAPFKANFGLLYKWKNHLVLYPKINYVSDIKTINYRGIDPSKKPIVPIVKGYNIIGCNIAYNNIVKGLNLNFKIDNLLNAEYYNPGVRDADGIKYNAQILQPGFNFMAGFSYKF